jgi:pyrroloquinoline quinone biosynthesis protein B
MRVRLLGTAAGGGFPQWNCNCACCRLARSDSSRARPRTQSSVAISAGDGSDDGAAWFLLNCSPDVRTQIESFPPLVPRDEAVRGTSIEGVLLTDADLDHTLGLFVLREGPPPMPVYATPVIRGALSDGLRLDEVMSHYAGIKWREPPGRPAPLRRADGGESGLSVSAFAVPGTAPRYARQHDEVTSSVAVVGYRIIDRSTGGHLVYAPHVGAVDDSLLKQLGDSDLLLLDGTCWSDDELRRAGVSDTTTARQMGHLPVGGEDGSMRRIAPLAIKRKVYLHLNNTNPMLIEDSSERREVESRGIEVGFDGMEFAL